MLDSKRALDLALCHYIWPVMTELARDKIHEAEFFLDKMQCTTNSSSYRYYLSAFLSACWSVSDQLRAEWGDNNGFKQWHNQEVSSLMSDSSPTS
jgi:hypothetical protein